MAETDDRPGFEDRIEDALFMLAHGEYFDRAASRLGISAKTLERTLHRAGFSINRVEGKVMQ